MSDLVSLKRNADFKRIYKRGKIGVTPTLVVYGTKNKYGNRIGITAGKKVGCAARRNRAKRRIRALWREQILKGNLLPEGCCADMVIVARHGAPDVDFDRLRKDFITAVRKSMKQIDFGGGTKAKS